MTTDTMPSDDAIRHLAALVAFPTVSASSNLAILDHLEEVCRPFGVRMRRFPDETGEKASLLVSIGPEAPGGLILSGHTDVVPVEGQAWTGDPWTLRQAGSRVVGRGATDMKGFLACCLALLPALARRPLRRPVHLAFSYDEEVGCTGVWPMAEWIGASDLRPRLAVIGEPSRLKLVAAHKGGLVGWARIRGKPGHSSQPDRYVNAVMAGAELVAEISRIRAEMRDGPLFEGLDPPYSTIQVNRIQGGTAGNIVAETCDLFWEMRIVPGEDPQAVLARMRRYAAERIEPAMKAVDPACGISFDVRPPIPGLAPEPAEILAAPLALLDQEAPLFVPYGTEAGIFQRFGTPSVILGPGDIADAHQPDESIAISELARCTALLGRLCEATCE